MLTAYQRLRTVSPLAHLLLVADKVWCREIGSRDLHCISSIREPLAWLRDTCFV